MDIKEKAGISVYLSLSFLTVHAICHVTSYLNFLLLWLPLSHGLSLSLVSCFGPLFCYGDKINN